MIRFTFTLVAVIALLTPFAYAASPPPSPRPRTPARSPSGSPKPNASANPSAASFDMGVWTVHANSIDANFKNGDFSTPAKVVMTRVGGDVSADRANGNYKKQVLFLNGHVVMHDSQGTAQQSLEGGPPGPPSPSTLTADKAQIDGMAKLYKAIGNVHYTQADTVVNADNGTLNDADHTLLLEGAVHISQGTRNMSAGKVLYNTVTGSAHAEGDVTMQFPSELHRKLATPRPLKIPKNGLTEPVEGGSSPPQ
jgi:lipopolysaccharide assembly outer membrane protein LptD (OstA)